MADSPRRATLPGPSASEVAPPPAPIAAHRQPQTARRRPLPNPVHGLAVSVMVPVAARSVVAETANPPAPSHAALSTSRGAPAPVERSATRATLP